MDEKTDPRAGGSVPAGGSVTDEEPATALLPVLERLDRLLERAVALTEDALGSDHRGDRFRGLYLAQQDVERSLAQRPGGERLFGSADATAPLLLDMGEGSRLGILARAFELSAFDVNVLLLALAPEIDLKYERIYAFLQDNVTRTRPTVELALNLLSTSVSDKMRALTHFEPAAPLFRHAIVEAIAEPAAVAPPRLGHFLRVDPQIAAFLLGMEGLDSRLIEFVEPSQPTGYLHEASTDHETIDVLTRLLDSAIEVGAPLRIHLLGARGSGRKQLAAAIAMEAGVPLLTIDVPRMLTSGLNAREAVRLIFRQAWMDDVVLLFAEIDALFESNDTVVLETFRSELSVDGGITLSSGEQPWSPDPALALGVVTVQVQPLGVDERHAVWRSSAARHGIILTEAGSAMLAGRFRLTAAQIEDATSVASQQLRCEEARDVPAGEASAQAREQGGWGDRTGDEQAALTALLVAARYETGHELAKLTQRVSPNHRLRDIVLPEETTQQLRDICGRVAARHIVMDVWGWDDKLSSGKGTSALFSGPPGCGKTMAAEVVAAEVGLELYRIDLATVMDKYIGETEKKLARIFDAAEASNSVLLFDEADALFGKRSAVRDSHDRYANVEISYLLQKIEEYEGLAILATNLPQNLDEAFTRRLSFHVRFPPPDAAGRRRIWEMVWPDRTPLAEDIDLDLLAREYRLTGGNIKNIAMAASFLAAREGGDVGMAHVMRAARRELAQLGAPAAPAGAEGRSPMGQDDSPPSPPRVELLDGQPAG